MRSFARKTNPWQFRIGERKTLLLVGDFLMAVIALIIAIFVWGSSVRFIEFNFEFLRTRIPLWFYLLPLIWLVLLNELYDIHRAGDWKRTFRGVAVAALFGLGLYLVLFFFYTGSSRSTLPRLGVAVFFIAATILTLIWRRFYILIFTAPHFMRRVLMVGAGKTGEMLLRIVNDLWPAPFYLVGIIDDDPEKIDKQFEGYTVLGCSSDMAMLIDEHRVSDIIVAISGEMQGSMFQTLLDAQERGIEISRMPVVYEELLGRVPIQLLEADWILRAFVDQNKSSRLYDLVKRFIDILAGIIGLVFTALLFPFIALAILLDDGFPIFYTQTRSGKGGISYRIYKFRTMRRDAEADGLPRWAEEADERATRVGYILRKTHLDELPQFLNVLRGEMSLVGPRAERPELVQHFQEHVPFYRARLLVKPGITGWAQVNYGYASTVKETVIKLEYDLYYIKNRNLFMDMLILLRTPATVLGFKGR